MKVEILHFSTQGIHVHITSLVHQYSFTATFYIRFQHYYCQESFVGGLKETGHKLAMDSSWRFQLYSLLR
jgi:hypothetical protein